MCWSGWQDAYSYFREECFYEIIVTSKVIQYLLVAGKIDKYR